jgi:UDP:flavonoid glycosyltransferase YjiC (YdhE family)
MTTVAFFPEGAYGPTNNCIGIGDVLRRRGVRVVFIVEESFAGTLEPHGFEELLMRLTPEPAVEEEPGQFWKDFIRDTAPVFRRSTFEQLEGFMRPTWQALIDGARHVEPRLREILEEVRPDAVVEDNVVCFPAVLASGAPWVRIASCNPLELKDPGLPPPYSGLRMDEPWGEFRAEYRRLHEPVWQEFDAWVREQGAEPLPELEFIHESPWLDLYLYPEEADYPRSRPLAPVWRRLDSCVRATEEAWEPPEGEGRLLYLSLGSLGAADVELMQRLIDLLGEIPHRVVVSMGPQHDLLRLAPNMTGAELVPQTRVLPHADLVITHGGNNTVTECFHFGRPMLALPIFWDQHDNAARVEEAGFGRRLPTYSFEDAELLDAVDELLADSALRERLAAVSRRLQAVSGTERAADLIERLAREKRPIAR